MIDGDDNVAKAGNDNDPMAPRQVVRLAVRTADTFSHGPIEMSDARRKRMLLEICAKLTDESAPAPIAVWEVPSTPPRSAAARMKIFSNDRGPPMTQPSGAGSSRPFAVTVSEAELLEWVRGTRDGVFHLQIRRVGSCWAVTWPESQFASGSGRSFDDAWAQASSPSAATLAIGEPDDDGVEPSR